MNIIKSWKVAERKGCTKLPKTKAKDFHKDSLCLFITAVKSTSKDYFNILPFPPPPKKIKFCLKSFTRPSRAKGRIFLP